MKVFIGADHLGKNVVLKVMTYLQEHNYEVVKSQVANTDEDDYPDFAYDVCQNVLKENGLGILLCGTGIGMSIAANKVKGIRCAKVSNVDEAYFCRYHNNANVLALSYNIAELELYQIIEAFLTTNFSHAPRHERRIEKISKIENNAYNL